MKETFRKMLNSLLESKSVLRLFCIPMSIASIITMIEAGITSTGLRTHNCRRTGAYYASRLGVPESTIKV